ncbi:MAG TPA: type VI secretion system protein IglI family protein [Polyangiales bacterium]|nr:type VI secretion system protein IglI family protein [Polyangiales bacterium]
MPDDASLRGLERLRAQLPPNESAGLDSVDPRLAMINSLCEKNQLRDLVLEVDELMDAGVYDIRPISMYLWAVFGENGLAALSDIFDTLGVLVTTNLEAIGPSQRKVDHVAKRITWLMQKLTDSIEYHEVRHSDEWEKWSQELAPATIDTALQRLAALETSLDDRFATVRPAFQKLSARLRVVSLAFRIPAHAPVSIASPVIASMRPPTHGRAHDELTVDARLGRAEVGVSHEFFALIQKLEAFSKLVKKGDLARAAIVADDLMQTIDAFDPRRYFPELFSDFSELLSKHIDVLTNHWQDRDSPSWKAHSQFYRVDLKRFVGGG